MSKWLIRCLCEGIVLVLILTSYAIPAEKAVKAEDFYKGKILRFIVPFPPGGGYDLRTRFLGPYIEKNTGATLVIENLPAGIGVIGAEQIYKAKPDGLTIGGVSLSALLLSQKLGYETITFDLEKFSLIGRPYITGRVLIASKASGFKTLDDMKKAVKIIRFGVEEPTTSRAIDTAAFLEAIGIKGKITPGYKGTRELYPAVITGRELDALLISPTGAAVKEIQEGVNVTLIVNIRSTPNTSFPGVLNIFEWPGLSAEGKKFLKFADSLSDATYIVVAPPNTPKDKIIFLEKALLASVKEPAYIDFEAKQGSQVNILLGQDCKALLDEMMRNLSPAEIPRLKHILLEKYY